MNVSETKTVRRDLAHKVVNRLPGIYLDRHTFFPRTNERTFGLRDAPEPFRWKPLWTRCAPAFFHAELPRMYSSRDYHFWALIQTHLYTRRPALARSQRGFGSGSRERQN